LRRKRAMGSSERSNLKEKITPFLAMTQADLEGMVKSKIVWGWIIAASFLGVIRILGSRTTGASFTITQGLSDFIFIWSMIIIGIAGSTVSSESGELADSLLSKAVKRHEYILAKFCSRIILIFTIYAGISTVLAGLTARTGVNDIEIYGLSFSILVVALVLITLTTLGVTFSTILPNTIMSIVELLVIWYSMTFFFPLINEIEFLSPSYLIGELPKIIQGNWSGTEWKIVSGFSLMSIAFIAVSLLYFSTKDV
jgi:ABC-type transport system involved in multi-copper enzyme maturation permease subunit